MTKVYSYLVLNNVIDNNLKKTMLFKSILMGFASILFLLPNKLSAQVDWIPAYRSQSKKTVLWFPKAFDTVLDTVELDELELPVRMLRCVDAKSHSGNQLYQMVETIYPENSFPKDSVERIDEFLDQSVSETLVTLQAEQLFSEPLDSKKYRGQIFRAKWPSDEKVGIYGRVVVKDDKVYQLIIVGKVERGGQRARKHFFDSFNP